ncbi:hypothetical protein [Cumulibacter soli]|uniref:hypothetical protein n=1 Tax=Cumulibacter soli TaxID=2546344 RepID=UPI0010676206|nr:hypothetical protein [Cumulibacter soli]
MTTTIQWQHQIGTTWDSITLHGDSARSIRVLKNGTTGLDAPPHTLDAITGLGVHGERLRGWRYEPRDVTLAVMIRARSRGEYLDKWARLLQHLTPQRGTGLLRITSEGFDRFLTCSFVGGMEGDLSRDREGDTWWLGELRFRAHDPFWSDSALTSVTFSENTKRKFFPIFPIKLNPNATFGSFVPGTTGDAPSWPSWTAYGPFDELEFYSSTGDSFRYGRAMPTGARFNVDFDPLATTIGVGGYGDNPALGVDVWDGVIWPSQLWPITADGQEIGASMSGTGPTSRIVLEYRTRWLSWRSTGPQAVSGTGDE